MGGGNERSPTKAKKTSINLFSDSGSFALAIKER
jgi:hypothetical protein